MKHVFLNFCLLSLIASAARANFHITDHYLGIGTSIPPAIIVVTDSVGNKAGVDSTQPVDAFGRGASISQIQGSDVEQVNIASDEAPLNQPQANTGWTISFMDQPAQSYVVNLTGISSGVTSVFFHAGFKGTGRIKIPFQKHSFLMEKGVSRTVTVAYDPTAGALIITPIINSGDFLRDTQSACSLKDIAPDSACDVLTGLAASVEKAITKGDIEKERNGLELYLRILTRLHNWGGKGFKKDWDDFKDHSECDALRNDKSDKNIFARDPAYSALKLEAETLLKALPADRKHHGMMKSKKIRATGATIIKKGTAKISKG